MHVQQFVKKNQAILYMICLQINNKYLLFIIRDTVTTVPWNNCKHFMFIKDQNEHHIPKCLKSNQVL